TSEFTFKPYRTRYSPDYVAQPTIGYERDNFGRGFFGGTAVSLSDILGNHTMVFSGSVNGRLSEAQVLALYANQAHRLNWYFGGSQQPLRSEEHTSELQSRGHLVCRLLLEKKKTKTQISG